MSFVLDDLEVDETLGGDGTSTRRSVKAASTGNINLLTDLAGATIDGIMVMVGSRILLKNQSVTTQNGIYVVESGAANTSRAEDYALGQRAASTMFYVQQGTINGDTGWLCTNDEGSDIIGTNGLSFQQFTGKGVDGNVDGPGSSTDNALVRWDSTTGKLIQNSGVILDDSNHMSGLGYLQLNDTTMPANPSNGQGRLYKKTGNDGLFWKPDSDGAEMDLTDTGAAGEANTASNIGTSGIGVFKQKTGVNFEFKKINAGSNKVTIIDDTGNNEVDINITEGNINHDALLNFVANEHIDHTTVSISPGEGLTGGGTIAANRTLSLNINGLTEDSTPVISTDFIATYDASATNHKKVKLSTLVKIRDYYDAIVDATGAGDFTSVAAAFAAGNKTVFVRDGDYTETSDIIIPDGGHLIGESLDKVKITMSGIVSVKIDGSGGTFESAGTISITSGTNTVTGSGTSFTNLNPIGTNTYILIHQNCYLVTDVASNTSLTIAPTFRGRTVTNMTYWAQQMFSQTAMQYLTIIGSSGIGLHIRGVRHAVFDNIICRSNVSGINVDRCVNMRFNVIMSQNNSGNGMTISDTVACTLGGCQSYNSGIHGFSLTGKNMNIIMDGCQGSNSANKGLLVDNTAEDIQINNCIFNNNVGDGAETTPSTITTTFNGCTMKYNGGYGIDIDGDHCIIDGCIVSYNGIDGIRSVTHATVTNCHAVGNAAIGISLEADSECQVSANFISQNGTDGIYTNMHNHTISGNVIETNSSQGIRIDGGSRNTISGNFIEDNGSQGIYLSAGGSNNIIDANVIKSNTIGIELSTSGHHDTIITNNNVLQNSSHGIVVRGNTCVVNDNRCVGNSGNGIRIESGYSDITYYGNNTQGNTGAGFVDNGTITTNYEALLANRVDARSATTLQLGFSNATKVELGKNGISTEVQGTFTSVGNATLKGLLYPTSDGTLNQAIVTNAAGILSFKSVSLTTQATVTTTNATATDTNLFATSSNKSYYIDLSVIARRTDSGSQSAGYKIRAAFRNVSGTLTRIARSTTQLEDVSAWAVDLITSGTMIVWRVIGANGSTINWKAEYTSVDV